MFSQLHFRKKIILSQIISFFIFLLAFFPWIEQIASLLVRDSLIESTKDLKELIEKSSSIREAIKEIQDQQSYAFFRISLINSGGLVIFDTHLNRTSKEPFQPYRQAPHQEIEEALKKGVGYTVASSDTFGIQFAYVAQTFLINGKTYVLRTWFPYEQIQELTKHFKTGVIFFSFGMLLFFNALIWFIFHRMTTPIQEIIDAIAPYQKGEIAQLPLIALKSHTNERDDFQRLANTLNSLSKKIQEQINDLRKERNEKEAILESLGEGVIAIDEKLHVLYINFVASKMLSVSRSQTLGKELSPDGDKVNMPLLQACKNLLIKCQRGGQSVATSCSFGNEQKVYIDLLAAPKAHGAGAIVVLQDKTNHHRILEMGKNFVANASHELRTPITIIKGYAETLHDIAHLSNTQREEITQKIESNCKRMENLITSLLTLADIDNLPLGSLERCNLISVLHHCRHAAKVIHPTAEVEIISSESELIVDGESGLLELAFTNLLDNGAKYSPSPAQITLSVNTMGDEAIVSIQDRGIGIPPEDLDHIFERFYRVDKSHSRKWGGAGLGLSIVKTIISKHGGRIKVSSTLHKGTLFTIILPLRPSS